MSFHRIFAVVLCVVSVSACKGNNSENADSKKTGKSSDSSKDMQYVQIANCRQLLATDVGGPGPLFADYSVARNLDDKPVYFRKREHFHSTETIQALIKSAHYKETPDPQYGTLKQAKFVIEHGSEQHTVLVREDITDDPYLPGKKIKIVRIEDNKLVYNAEPCVLTREGESFLPQLEKI